MRGAPEKGELQSPGRSKILKKLNVLPHALLHLWSAKFRRIEQSPVFIVGCGHSGTTLLLRILGAHRSFYPIIEESNTFSKARYHNLRTFDLLAFFKGKKRWIEKTPKHIRHIDEIFAFRPDAKLIFIIRDGRDVALSIKKRTGRIEDGIERWLADNALGYAWIDDPRVIAVRYEDLVGSFRAEMTRLLDFLGEPYDDNIEQFQKVTAPKEAVTEKPESQFGNRAHFQHRMWQVSQPLFDGRNKWRREMTPEEIELFRQRAGAELVQYGYEQNSDW